LIVKALRGLVKSAGRRLPVCSTASFQIRAEASVPATLAAAAKPLLEKVEALNRSVAGLVLPASSVDRCRLARASHRLHCAEHAPC
jgi:hypothetical protein